MTIDVTFTIEVEEQDRREFQYLGHFIPGMTDDEGFRREWKGDTVHIGTLWQDAKDEAGNVTAHVQVLRVLADSLPELHRLMSRNIRTDFFARFIAQQQQSTVYDQFHRAAEEHKALVGWLLEKGFIQSEGHAGLSTAALCRKVLQERG